jgi:hypothetical protein
MASSSSSSPPALDIAAEYHALKALYDKQNEMGHAVVADNTKLKAEKAALQQKLERGGASKLLQHGSKFTGQGGMLVEEWVDDLEKQYNFFHISEVEKVETAVMLLKGPAAHWWKTLATKGEATVIWHEFVAKMKDMFQPISSIDKARAGLDQCVQGKRSVQAYTDAFRRIIQFLPEMDEGDQKHRYTTNLNDTLRTEVLKAKAKTLEEAIHAAVSAEAYGSDGRKVKLGGYYPAPRYGYHGHGSANSNTGHTPMELSNINLGAEDEDAQQGAADSENGDGPANQPSTSSSSSSGPTARERHLLNMVQELQAKQRVQDSIHAMFNPRGGKGGGAGSTRVPGVSKADYERCRKEGRCIRCKQTGHIARECTKPVSLKW